MSPSPRPARKLFQPIAATHRSDAGAATPAAPSDVAMAVLAMVRLIGPDRCSDLYEPVVGELLRLAGLADLMEMELSAARAEVAELTRQRDEALASDGWRMVA